MEHLKEFSPDQKFYAFIDFEGKLKIWDVEANVLKQEYVPNLHLSTPCTALLWIQGGNLKAKKNKKAKSDTTLYIALGTSKGGIALYSFATGQLQASFEGNGHGAGITSLVYNGKDSIYSCGLDSKVVEWSVSQTKQISIWDCGPEKPTAISLIPETNLIIIASKQIKVFNLDTKKVHQTFTGHATTIRILKSFEHDDNQFILSGAKTDRQVSIWKINKNETEAASDKSAFGHFALNGSPSFLSLHLEIDELRVVCVATDDSLLYFTTNLKSMKPNKKPIKSRHQTQIASDNVKTVGMVPIKAACIVNEEILIGYGNLLLKFELIPTNQKLKVNVLVRNDPMIASKKKQGIDGKLLNVVTPITENNVEYLNVISSKKSMKTVEIPMESRLENMSLGDTKKPNAKNMAQLLVQGLHSNDATIMRMVLRQNDEETIRATLKRLPPQYVINLVTELTSLMSKKAAGSQTSLIWLKNLVQIHASQLMALGPDNLAATFGICLGIIDHRAQNLPALSRLRGRLDLLVSQMKSSDVDEDLNNDHLLVYQEIDDAGDSALDNSSNSSEESLNDDFDEEEQDSDAPTSKQNGNKSTDSENDEEMDYSD